MERDTDKDWQQIAEADPYWGVLTHDEFRGKTLNEDAIASFYSTGVTEIDGVLARIRGFVPEFRPKTALDFGCGAGRLTLALARHVEAATGVDIAPGMLARARDAAGRFGVKHARFVDDFNAVSECDWLNSSIVFQHIPPRRGYAIMNELLGKLTLGGVCSIQVPLFRDRPALGQMNNFGEYWFFDGETARIAVPDDREAPGVMFMFDYDMNRILAMMHARGIEPFGLEPTDHGGCHGAWIFARRTSLGDVLVPDREYGPRGVPSVASFLREGWSFPEHAGVWTVGSEAGLAIRFDPAIRATHKLVLSGRAYLPGKADGRIIAVLPGDEAPERWLLDRPDAAEQIEVPLTGGTSGELAVRILVENPARPADHGVPGDVRPLGFMLSGMRLEPRAPAALRPGQVYGAAEPASFAPFLRRNWYELEEWGAWTRGEGASMRLDLSAVGPTAALMLRLRGRAFVVAEHHPTMTLTARVNGSEAATATLSQPENIVFDIPLQHVGPGGFAVIELLVDKPTTAEKCGLGDDQREIGFGLEQLEIVPIGTPPG
jgi:SAM-dependent methyltransferase